MDKKHLTQKPKTIDYNTICLIFNVNSLLLGLMNLNRTYVNYNIYIFGDFHRRFEPEIHIV